MVLGAEGLNFEIVEEKGQGEKEMLAVSFPVQHPRGRVSGVLFYEDGVGGDKQLIWISDYPWITNHANLRELNSQRRITTPFLA